MWRVLRRRLLMAVPLMLGVITLSFVLIQLAPGSFFDVMTSDQQVSDAEALARLRTLYGADVPWWQQLLSYLWSISHLDFGFSYRQNMPVLAIIVDRLPATLLLMLTSLGIAVLVGVAAGVLAAVKVRTIWDTLVSILVVICFAAPSFWVGIMLIILFSVKLGWLPVGGYRTIGAASGGFGAVVDVLRHLILPAVALGLFYAAIYARLMRSSMLEVSQADYVRTARAKGLSGTQVTLRHIFRN